MSLWVMVIGLSVVGVCLLVMPVNRNVATVEKENPIVLDAKDRQSLQVSS